MQTKEIVSDQVELRGFTLITSVLATAERGRLIDALGPVIGAGRRGVLNVSAVAQIAASPVIAELVRPHTPNAPRPVRALYFDKSAHSNWTVGWHQDLTIAVRRRLDVPGFGPWSVKDGVPHVQPPEEVLENMTTVRLHLDDCDESNGALRVLPGTHRQGRILSESIQQLRREIPEVVCRASAGDILLMRPLLLHSSNRSSSGQHRRVLHIEYSATRLPHGLEWHEQG